MGQKGLGVARGVRCSHMGQMGSGVAWCGQVWYAEASAGEVRQCLLATVGYHQDPGWEEGFPTRCYQSKHRPGTALQGGVTMVTGP